MVRFRLLALTTCLLGGLISPLAVARPGQGEEIDVKARVFVSIGGLFPKRSGVQRITDDYFKGTFDSEGTKKQIEATLALSGKEKWVESALVERWYEGDYDIQDLGVTLPGQTPEIRHQLRRSGETAQWSTYKTNIHGTGYLDDGAGSFTVTAPVGNSLLGFVPEGSPSAKLLSRGEAQASFAEGVLAGPGQIGRERAGEARFTVYYSDTSRRSIRRIDWRWNKRVRSPNALIEFEGSRVEGRRHTFSLMRVTRFDAGRIASIAEFRPVARRDLAQLWPDPIPKGTQFIDRRQGEERNLTFSYEGRFPTQAETSAQLDSAQRRPSAPVPGRAVLQFLAGFGLLVLGIALWRRARRIKS